jgi:type I restriction enzyme S subunit
MCFPDSVVGFNAFPEESSELFMHYVFTFIRQAIQNSASGSIQDNINLEYLTGLNFKVPEKSEQDRIVAVLSALDAKIALNTRINAELEALAKLIYDYWFVQFDFPISAAQAKRMGKPKLAGQPYKSSGGAMVHNKELKREVPEGWEVGTLSDLAEIIGGSTPSTANPSFFMKNGTAWITPKDLSNNSGNRFITRGETDVSPLGITSTSLKLMPAGTVLLSTRAPIGYMAISRETLTTNQGFKSFVPNKGYSTEFIYETVRSYMPAIVRQSAGTTFQEVSKSALSDLKVCLAPKPIVEDFTKLVSPMFQQQNVLEAQNQELAALRDWLLPLLMNGQVVVRSDDQTIGRSDASAAALAKEDDGSVGPPSRSATAENMALAAEAAGRYGKKR